MSDDTDWKAKEAEALAEGHHWAIEAGLQFDKTWENRKPSFNLYKKGKLLASASTAWKYRDLAYDLCPYYLATEQEIRSQNKVLTTSQSQQTAMEFIAQVIEAIEPETEDELLMAILDNNGCDWGIARSMFRQLKRQ